MSCYNFKVGFLFFTFNLLIFVYYYRYFATGDQILSIVLAYRISESTARNIIKETCNLIIKILAPIYLKAPTEQEWIEIS